MRNAFLAALLSGLAAFAVADPVRIVFDTDMCGDYDDVGALAVLNALADSGECEILGVVSSSRGSPALGMSEIINTHYGRGNLPMGVCRDIGYVDPQEGVGGAFRSMIVSWKGAIRFPNSDSAPDANEIYRRALASSPDRSVTLCTVGFLTNIRRLLETPPDAISPLTGRELVARKATAWYVMGGTYPEGNECNFREDAESTRLALAASPVPIYFLDFNMGADVLTGVPVSRARETCGPVAEAFVRGMKCFGETGKGRPSWDELTVLAAVRGWNRYFDVRRGTMQIVNGKGDNRWTDDEKGNHYVLVEKTPKSELRRIVDELMTRPPQRTKPYVWWHWAGTAVTEAGIRRDLDAMAAAGIGGATIFQVARGPCSEVPAEGYDDETNPGLVFGDDTWFDLVAFAVREAKRRGLEIGMHNCPGYTVSGGPWITPELAMKKLVWSVAPKGETPPEPEKNLGFYRDIGTVEKGDEVYRFGYTCTGSQCMPVAKALIGNCLEADKMNARAINFHLDHILRRDVGLDFILMDSYEAGPYDWTDDFRGEFIRRRGYDPLAYLPAYVGAVREDAEKIKADMARTVQELSTERHYWVFRDRLHAKGLGFFVEPYGGPFDTCEAAYASDMPTTEFWGARPFWVPEGELGGHAQMGGAAGRAAGRRILAAEAFTAMPFADPYVLAPKDFKACADASFARGINRMLLHHWVHQPFPACRRPGMNMGYWGSHFGENQTWFEPGQAFFRYLGECQKWLQLGEEVIDILSVEVAPEGRERLDAVPRRVFLEGTKPKKGRLIVTDSDRSYSHLLVPPELMELPEIAAKVAECRKAGVRIVDRDDVVKGPFEITGGVPVTDNGPVLATARRIPETDARFFFVANVSTNPVVVTADYRAEGVAEIRDPETGDAFVTEADSFEDGYSRLTLALPPLGSKIVFFAEESALPPLPAEENRTVLVSVTGPWSVSFEANRGAPEGEVEFTNLVSFAGSDVFGIRHFSGTATYRTEFTCTNEPPANAVLALGDVRDIARVRVNGRDLGVAWHFPFEVRTCGALKAGVNRIEIEVTNGWHNRLLGDRTLPEDCEWGPERFHQCSMDGSKGDCGRGLRRMPEWVWNSDGSRPSSGRVTFTVWDYFNDGDRPVDAGLLGPVAVMW